MVGFLIGLTFTQRCGNYFVTMFDDYSATLPLIIVVIFQTISVAWVYGADRYHRLSECELSVFFNVHKHNVF